MSRYGIDLGKVESKFNEVLKTEDNKKIADFAKEVIPLLLKESARARKEIVNNILN